MPATSLTFIITSLFCVNTCLLEDTQVAPLSKLYGVDCKPDSASDAVIVNVTSPFVHAVGFPVTPLIVGATLSIFEIVTLVSYVFPSLSFTFILPLDLN